MTVTGYSTTQVRLHWAVAVLVLAQIVLADGMAAAFDAGLTQGTRVFTAASVLHASSGGLILLLTFIRFSLRQERGVPTAAVGEPGWQSRIARGVHLTFYAVLLVSPILGALAWGGGSETLGGVHAALGTVLLVLIALHVGAALYGQFVQRTGVLARMLRPSR